jgi:hypothetical protein
MADWVAMNGPLVVGSKTLGSFGIYPTVGFQKN